MRTTVDIPAPLLENAKQRAAERGITLSELVQDGLRALLSRDAADSKRPKFKLHTVRGRIVDPSLDLDRTSALLAQDDVMKFGPSSR